MEYVTHVIDLINVTREIVMNRSEEDSGEGERQPENDSESIFSIDLSTEEFEAWKDSLTYLTWKDALTYLGATAARMGAERKKRDK